jgi:hypothetical protein
MFNEIMSLDGEKDCSLVLALDRMSKYTKNIQLLTTEKHDVFYRVDANTIRNANLENDELLSLNQGGWRLSENKEFIEYYI